MSCFQNFLRKCKRKNPAIFAADTIKLRVSSFEAALEAAYDAGKEEGLSNARDFARGSQQGFLAQFFKSLGK